MKIEKWDTLRVVKTFKITNWDKETVALHPDDKHEWEGGTYLR